MRPSRQMQPFIRPWPAGKPSIVAILVAFAVAAAFAEWTVAIMQHGDILGRRFGLHALLALTVEGMRHGRVWEILTYGLLNAGPIQLCADVLLLYFAGREVEPIIGRGNFLFLFAFSNVAAGALQFAAMRVGLAPSVPVAGISAAVCAVVAAYATILPELEVSVRLFFIVPIRLKTKVVGIASVCGVAALVASRTAPQIGTTGMLAGFFIGWVYVKSLGYGNPLAIQRFLYRRRQREARLARMPAEQFINEEIDPILDKISREGMQSLTRAERKVLEKGRAKIAAKTGVR